MLLQRPRKQKRLCKPRNEGDDALSCSSLDLQRDFDLQSNASSYVTSDDESAATMPARIPCYRDSVSSAHSYERGCEASSDDDSPPGSPVVLRRKVPSSKASEASTHDKGLDLYMVERATLSWFEPISTALSRNLEWFSLYDSSSHEERWAKLCCDGVPALTASSKLLAMVRAGIPTAFRGRVWQQLAGSRRRMDTSRELYQQMWRKTGLSESSLAHIQLPDMCKVPPELLGECNKQNLLLCLRRVVTVYQCHNPNMDQSPLLHHVVAALLLFMGEQEAFWLLDSCVQNILPEGLYAKTTLYGCTVEQRVMGDLLRKHYPVMANKLEGMGQLEGITCEWMLSCFVGQLPFDVAMRMWDCMFYDAFVTGQPSSMMLHACVSIFKKAESEIMAVKVKSGTQLSSVLRAACRNVTSNELLQGFMNCGDPFMSKQVNSLRYSHRMVVLAQQR